MSAPLPCCSRMRPIMPRAVSICRVSTMVNKTFIPNTPLLWSRGARGAGRGNDLKEIRGLERSAADEAAVDVRLRQQAGRIGRVHAAAVEDVHAFGLLGRGSKLRAQQRMHLLGLL